MTALSIIMSQAIERKPKFSQELRDLYAPIQAELDAVERILREHLTSKHPFVDRLVKHGFRLGGKRMRPALVLLSAKACGRLDEKHITLAATVEMIHTATLIHDDVLDEAAIRRHLDTVNARWDNETSILLGDYLFSQAICMANSLDSSFANQAISEATRAMCEGELRQVESRGNFELSEEAYLDIISGKTAALISCCCQVSAHLAGATPEMREAFTRFGRYLGIAFQVVDDMLDVLGDEGTTGKSLGTDLLKQKATLPLIRLLDQLDDRHRPEVLAILARSDNHKLQALQPWFANSDALAYAREKALGFASKAVDQLDGIADETARDAFERLVDFVISRKA